MVTSNAWTPIAPCGLHNGRPAAGYTSDRVSSAQYRTHSSILYALVPPFRVKYLRLDPSCSFCGGRYAMNMQKRPRTRRLPVAYIASSSHPPGVFVESRSGESGEMQLVNGGSQEHICPAECRWRPLTCRVAMQLGCSPAQRRTTTQ